MKKRSILKKLSTAVLTTVMMLSGISAQAFADTSLPVVDTRQQVSLTVTKYVPTDGGTFELDDNLTGTVADAPSEGVTVLKDVSFTAVKVADLVQDVTVDGKNVSLAYKLTEQGAEATGLGSAGTIVTGTQLNTYIQNKTANDFAGLEDKDNAKTAVTDENGVAVFTDKTGSTFDEHTVQLTEGQGLYLVVETKAPANVTKRAHPFFASLPMTDKVNADKWIYDVYAYPKNSTASTDIDKKISAVNDNTSNGIADGNKTAEAQINDVITYEVPLTAVVPDSGLTKLFITDTMSKGLTFLSEDENGGVDVYLGTDTNGTKLTYNTDYTVTVEKDQTTMTTKLKVDLNQYLAKLNAGTDKNPKFLFVYKAKLNQDVVLGQQGNDNEVYFTYNYNNGPSSDIDSEHKITKVFTWGIDLTKIGENAEVRLKDVVFELTNTADKHGTAMKFIYDEAKKAYTPSDDAAASSVLTTNAEGKIVIKGLERGTYSLKETKTNKGYVLLKEAVVIVISGDDANKTGTAVATVGGKTVTLAADGDSASALVPVTVVNNKGFDLPATGGTGTAMFTIFGIAVAVIAAALLLMRKKKSA